MLTEINANRIQSLLHLNIENMVFSMEEVHGDGCT